ncbi:MAG: hypothetical protein H6727_04230 [Myxococcales bacterium]|nr:hypothetical protein [Myxococcales bacterium]
MYRWRHTGLFGSLMLWWWFAACVTPAGTCQEDSQCKNGQRCVQNVCACPDGNARCGETCVDLLTDKANCGACGTACAAGQYCENSKCSCLGEQVVCGGACVDLQANAKHCGNCGAACKTGEKCAQGRCLANCPSLTPDACGDACANLQTDAQHCGTCGNACASGQICQNAQCACPGGKRACDKTCADIERDPANCGACGNACPSGQSCAVGECVQACPASRPTLCLGSCVDLSRDVEHCGKCGESCPEGQRCQDSRCSCPSGSTLCGGRCIDLQNNAQHCGACDNPCASGTVCAGGFCIPSCPAATSTTCLGGCVDTQTNPDHCGACGKACPEGSACQAGACACPNGQELCDNQCIDNKINRLHCGGCGKACKAGEVCSGGSCVASCPANTSTICDGGCFDIQQDARHCGKCGLTCRAGLICKSGACSCPEGQTLCLGTCVDLKNNDQHCGKCGQRCASSESCEQSTCTLRCAPPTQLCDGSCVDTKTDSKHCGACGMVCGLGLTCKDSTCVCSAGRADCGDKRCVDILFNKQNCGACGNVCPLNQLCVNSACVCPPEGCQFVLQAKSDDPMGSTNYQQVIRGPNDTTIHSILYRGGSFSFQGKTPTSSPSAYSTFIFALDKDNKLLWSQEILGKGQHGVSTSEIKLDSHGDLFILGRFSQEITLGNEVLNATQTSSETQGFIAKINPQGQWVASKLLEIAAAPPLNQGSLALQAIDFHPTTGEILVGGTFAGKLTVANGSGAGISATSSNEQFFVLKLDASFQTPDIATTQTTASGTAHKLDVVFDSAGNAFVVGVLSGALSFGTNLLQPPAGENSIGFVVPVTFSTRQKWPTAPIPLPAWDTYKDFTRLVVPATGGGVVIAGQYEKGFSIGNITRQAPNKAVSYVLSIDASGAPRWIKEAKGPENVGSIFLRRLPSGELLWSVEANGEIQFGTYVLPYTNNSGGDISIHAFYFLNDNGDVQVAKTSNIGEIFLSGFQAGQRSAIFDKDGVLIGGSLYYTLKLYGKSYSPSGTEDALFLRFLFQPFPTTTP